MINPIGLTAPPARASASPRAGGPGFQIPTGPAQRAPASTEAEAAATASLLALQEDPPDRRDQAARERTEELLRELSALHRALLSGAPDGPALDRAEVLMAAMPAAHDPALAAIQRAVALRVRIEQARRGR